MCPQRLADGAPVGDAVGLEASGAGAGIVPDIAVPSGDAAVGIGEEVDDNGVGGAG